MNPIVVTFMGLRIYHKVQRADEIPKTNVIQRSFIILFSVILICSVLKATSFSILSEGRPMFHGHYDYFCMNIILYIDRMKCKIKEA